MTQLDFLVPECLYQSPFVPQFVVEEAGWQASSTTRSATSCIRT
jgi:hypothetical protein